MDSFIKRVLRIPLDKPFEEAYFTHRLWMFFRETKETEQDIHRIFKQIREKMKQRITLKKKSDPGKFAVPCLWKGIEFACALCDTCSTVSILPKTIADHLGGIIINLEVQIGNALVPGYFHVLENKQNMSPSLLLRRAFMAIVGAVCNMQTNQSCLTLINPDVYYDPVRVIKPKTSNTGFIAACHCDNEDEYKIKYSRSIDSGTPLSIDIAIHPPIDNMSRESINIRHASETFALPAHCYPASDID
uniref:Uncharacterized protein n=1 Tax=Brassica oleracea TaxID=3712 RepID=A0A3P6FPX1_BRAOL|nr:unnamed protein product [Brassica oleracea]